jgi:hypothetical protein
MIFISKLEWSEIYAAWNAKKVWVELMDENGITAL